MNRAILVALIGAIALVIGSVVPEVWKHLVPPRESATLPSPSKIQAPNPQSNTQSAGAARLQDGTLLCWGQAELPEGSGSHTRLFAFKFKESFAAAPTVTTSINVKSTGYAYAVYNHQLTEEIYSGSVVEVEFRKTPSSVTMHYFAIGTPKN